MNEGVTTKQPGWVRRLAGYAMRHRRDVILSLTAAVLGSAGQTVVPLLERHIVDASIVRHTSSLWPWLVALIAIALATFGMSYVRRYRGGRVALSVQYDLRNSMHAHLQRLDFATLETMPTGQLVARANSDSTVVQGLLSFLPIMSGNVLLMLLSLVVMLILSPLLAIVSLTIAPALLIVSYRMRRRVFPATWDAQQREGDVAQIVDEDVNGVRVVKAFGQEHRELGRVADAAQTLYGSQMRAVRLTARYQPILQAIPSLGQVAILALGGWLALRGEISLGTFLAFSTYVAQLMAPARQLAGLLAVGQQARASAERIFQLLDQKPEITDAAGATELPPVKGEIRFEDVTFTHDGNTEVLQRFDLTITAGERVAFVGPSGSGKTTLLALVSRFYDPTGGTVSIDGHPLDAVTLSSLRRQVGVVFEDSFLFSDSVRANIAYARPDADEDEIVAAALLAQADEFVRALPDGYDTVVGERGLTLSGGQRQRIALARAILADPAILILDDATSAVDAPTEEAINRGLREVLADRTTLLVAHRRSTLHLADRVVVLDGGRVADQGTHEELFARNGFYRELLTGIDETAAKRIGDRVEALSSITTTGITPSAWARSQDDGGRRFTARTIGAPSIGAGLGGGGGGWRKSLAPTPELIKAVAALRPVRDHATVDLDVEARPQPGFSLGALLAEFRRPLTLGLILVVLDAVASLFGPILVKTGLDSGVAKGSESALFMASAIFLVITVADLFDGVAESFVTGRTAQRIMLSLRIRIWSQLQRLSLDYYESELAGRIMTRMTTDVDQFESLVENGLLSALVSLVTFAGVGIALIVLNVTLGLATLSVVIPLGFATVAFRRRSVRLYDLARDRIATVNADFQESLSGVHESQAFVHEDIAIARFERLGNDYLEARVAAQRLVATYFPFVQFLSGIGDVIVLGVGARLIGEGRLTAGAVIAFILYVDLFFSPIQQLSQVFDAWQQTRISVGRIAELMQLETLTPSPEDPEALDSITGQISLENVEFSYPTRDEISRRRRAILGPEDDRPATLADNPRKPPVALRGVDLTIAAGETVALVGATGAGKSTVMKLLIRFYDPTNGQVRVDGHDLQALDLADFRSRIGYVPQEGFLFSGTIRDNIAYGRPDAGDAVVEAAARAVGAHDLVESLPGGYLHEIVERGRSLSAGQRQLIALARAELVDPAILLLDEATSSLDLISEARVAAAMQQVAKGRTTVVIAHRLQTAKTADRIITLADGRVAESGSHEQLIKAGGTYAAMWQAFQTLTGDAAEAEAKAEAS